MGSEDTTAQETGFLCIAIPYDVAPADVSSVLGTDYDEALPEVGPVEVDGPTGLRLEATGQLPAGVLTRDVYVTRGGYPTPGVGGAGVVYEDDESGTYIGADRAWMPSGWWRRVVSGTGVPRHAWIGRAPNDAAIVTHSTSTYMRVSSLTDASATTVQTIGDVPTGSGTASCACRGPDGAMLYMFMAGHPGRDDTLCYLRVYRSDAVDGSGAELQTLDALGVGYTRTDVERIRAEIDRSGALVLLVSHTAGATGRAVDQYASVDGGATWRLIQSVPANTVCSDVRQVSGYLGILSIEEWSVYTVTVTAGASRPYTVSVTLPTGGTVDVTTTPPGSPPSLAQVAQAIADAATAIPLLAGRLVAEASGADVTFTTRYAGFFGAFVVSESDADLTLSDDSSWRPTWRLIGSATQQAYPAVPTTLVTDDAIDVDDYGAAVQDDQGRVWVWGTFGSGRYTAYSDDLGSTWTSPGLEVATWEAGTTTSRPGRPTAACVAGAVWMVVDDSRTSGTATDALWALGFGGLTSHPTSIDVTDAPISYWWPCDTLANQGWTAGGAGTRTLDTGVGERIVTTGAPETSQRSIVSTAPVAIDYLRASVAAGDLSWQVRAGGANVTVQITPTQIRAHDSTAAAPAYTTRPEGVVEVLVSLDASQTRAIVAWRVVDTGDYVQDYSLIALTSLGAGTADRAQILTAGLNSDVTIRALRFGPTLTTSYTREGTTSSGPLFLPADYEPILLAPGEGSYLGPSVRLRHVSGLSVVDDVRHRIEPTSPYSLDRCIPSVDPSPRATWRSNQKVAQEITVDLQGEGPALLVVTLLGLAAVESVEVAINGATPASASGYAHALTYTSLGASAVMPAASGDGPGTWVRADGLRGWFFALEDGTVRRVLRNTEGLLEPGNASTSPLAVLSLDGAHDGEPAGAGTLYPPSCVLVRPGAPGVAVESVTVRFPATVGTWAGQTYREVGTIAVQRGHVIHLGPDLTDVVSDDVRAGIEEMPDGTRTSARTSPPSRTIEWTLRQSWHEVRQLLFGAGDPNAGTYAASPDWLRPGSSGIATTAGGAPYVVDGIVRRADGQPVTAVASVRYGTAETWECIVPWAGDEYLWGRLSDYGREAVPYIGQRGRTQVYRVPRGLVVTEEL